MINIKNITYIVTDESGATHQKQNDYFVIAGYITKQIGFSVWQKLFYDHIIRGEKDYKEIWEYIDNNPLKWELDRFFTL